MSCEGENNGYTCCSLCSFCTVRHINRRCGATSGPTIRGLEAAGTAVFRWIILNKTIAPADPVPPQLPGECPFDDSCSPCYFLGMDRGIFPPLSLFFNSPP